MSRLFHAVTSITASAISRGNRNRQLRRIAKTNMINRNLSDIGSVTPFDLFPDYTEVGNVCITGGDEKNRRSLIIQNVRQSILNGETVVVLHENDPELEQELSIMNCYSRYFRIINSSNPFYEPIFYLKDCDAASLIVSSSLRDHKIPDDGIVYLEALFQLLKKCSVSPYLRKMASCPHANIQKTILSAERVGAISADEANDIRNDINSTISARPSIETFFTELIKEGALLANKTNLKQSTSIYKCAKHNGVIIIDVGAMTNTTLLSLIVSELESIKTINGSLRLFVSADSIASSDRLIKYLGKITRKTKFTVSTCDLGNFAGTEKTSIEMMLALSHRVIVFSHGVRSAELISSEFGEYDYIEAHASHGGNTGIGGFGFHFGVNNAIKPEHNRERVVQPEEIEHLDKSEFYLLDNYQGTLSTGVLS